MGGTRNDHTLHVAKLRDFCVDTSRALGSRASRLSRLQHGAVLLGRGATLDVGIMHARLRPQEGAHLPGEFLWPLLWAPLLHRHLVLSFPCMYGVQSNAKWFASGRGGARALEGFGRAAEQVPSPFQVGTTNHPRKPALELTRRLTLSFCRRNATQRNTTQGAARGRPHDWGAHHVRARKMSPVSPLARTQISMPGSAMTAEEFCARHKYVG